MISSIIFAAIKDFMVTENPIAKNPIAGSFFKMGENFLNSLPGMQGSFETKVTDFIHSNLSGRIQQSEKLINSELDSGKEVELLEEFWTFLEGISFNEIDTLFPSTEIDKLFISVPGFHEHLKKTGFAEKWILCFNKIFYKKYDKVEISKILEETGIKREVLEVEVISFLTKVLDNGKIREFYKQRISERLEDFYSSERLNSILV
jgi:hypothetical protein